MTRPWRIQYKGPIYHIMSRGVDKGKIFFDNKDYTRFLEYLEKACEKFSIDIFAFVLMRNHYHLFLRTNEPNLSRAMQWIQTSYSVYYNHKHNRSGHLFQGRYKSIIVGEESYWTNLSIYIHLNPVRAGIVKEPGKYEWSSYHDYVNTRKLHRWLFSEAVLKGFDTDRKKSSREYRKLVREVSGKEKEILEETRYGLIMGSDMFVEWVQKMFIDRAGKKDAELPQQKKVSDDGIIEKVINEIVNNYRVEKLSLLERKRRIPDEARDAGMYILKMHSGLRNTEIGEVFGVSLSAVNKAALRISEKISSNKNIKRRIDRIVNSVFKV